jgi:hypothetical protein
LISDSTLVISPSRHFFSGGIDDAHQRELACSNDRRTGDTALRSGFAEGDGFRMQQDREEWCIFWFKGKICRMAEILTDGFSLETLKSKQVFSF